MQVFLENRTTKLTTQNNRLVSLPEHSWHENIVCTSQHHSQYRYQSLNTGGEREYFIINYIIIGLILFSQFDINK